MLADFAEIGDGETWQGGKLKICLDNGDVTTMITVPVQAVVVICWAPHFLGEPISCVGRQ